MLSYFTRRLAGGVLKFLLASFLTSFLVYSPFVPANYPGISWVCEDCNIGLLVARYETMYALDRPWPLSFLTWIYDPNGMTIREYTVPGHWTMNGHYAPTRTYRFERSGLLGVGFEELYGVSLTHFLALTLGPTLTLMLAATLQRRGKHPLRSLSFAHVRELHGIRPLHALG